MSTNKVTASDSKKSFLVNSFNGEREKWEEYHRSIEMMIKRNPDIPTEWKEYIFTDFPLVAGQDHQYVFTAEFTHRVVQNP